MTDMKLNLNNSNTWKKSLFLYCFYTIIVVHKTIDDKLSKTNPYCISIKTCG